MEYRTLPHGGEKIGVIGLGASAIGSTGDGEYDEREIAATAEAAFEAGVNYFDLAGSDAGTFAAYGEALRGVRDRVYYQFHFGANYETGSYGWTTDLETIKRSADRRLRELKTDYVDFGFIHCIDEESDLEEITRGGVIDYLTGLKKSGAVRHLGLSSHSPALAEKVLDLGIVDMLMFSINPAYDYRRGEFAKGDSGERMALYRRCEKDGVGISVMKAFAGGQLLDAKTSPFGKALGEYQCIRYALDKPAVLTVLPGVRGRTDLKRLLGYFSASPEETDYSVLGSFTPAEAKGRCVYCNHCEPCPAGLDIGMINKYYDLSQAGDRIAADHYAKLARRAGDCVGCGRCESRCPFGVKQPDRMKEIAAWFGA